MSCASLFYSQHTGKAECGLKKKGGPRPKGMKLIFFVIQHRKSAFLGLSYIVNDRAELQGMGLGSQHCLIAYSRRCRCPPAQKCRADRRMRGPGPRCWGCAGATRSWGCIGAWRKASKHTRDQGWQQGSRGGGQARRNCLIISVVWIFFFSNLNFRY